MQQTLRPYVTTGLAVVGVGLIAVPPVTSNLPQLQHQLATVEQRPVALTADGDFFSPYTDLFNHTIANLQALNQNSVDMFGLLEHIFTNPQQALAGIPDVINIFTNAMPTIDAQLLPFPADISIQLPLWINSLLAGIGPWVTLFNAMQDVLRDVFDFSDPMGALSALFGAPATLLDAFLNGSTGLNYGDLSIPLFNGLLTPGQPIDANFDIGSLVEMSGFGDTSITELLTQAGIGDIPLDTLITDLLDQAGFGHMTPVDLLNDFGIGTEPLSELLIGVFNEAGIGNPTIAQLLTDLGGISPDDSIASLLIALLNAPEVGIGNPTISELILSLVGGDDQSVGGLIKDLLGASGGESLASLVDPTWTVGGLITDALGNPPLTDLFAQLGLGDVNIGTGLVSVLGPMGEESLLSLLNSGFLGPDITGDTGLLDLLASMFPPGATLEELMADFGTMTLGQLMEEMPAGEGFPPDTMIVDIRLTELLSTVYLPGQTIPLGDTPLSQIPGFPPDMASLVEKAGNPTLNALLGTNTVGETLQNLGLYDATMTQLVQSVGLSDYELAVLFQGLGNLSGNVTLEEFFTDLGFNPTLAQIVEGLFQGMGLGDTSVLTLLEDWGLGSIGLQNLIDALGLQNLGIQDMLNDLGLNNIDLDMFIDRLGLSGISIAGLLSGLGLDNTHLDDFINSLLGGVSIGSMLDGLGLDEVHLDSFITDVMTSVLGDPTLGTLLGWLGLDNYDLDTIVGNLGLDGVTLNSLLTDLGIGSLDINGLVDGLGLSDLGLLSINGDFFGMAAEWLNDIPNQIAAALGFPG
ncbi:hypothetical protein MTER_00310 [Mycolicibacter terrae]|uniref:PE-PGRS family protein n=1 Tax=Mycolicibacter terrae TaxID=1788 RepID=A0AAD1MFT2_9MYCO|nr:hypothetical protein AWC28_11855 [Mycolicibacter terrae]BBX20620.1 hypothetical protein MTER_00310 [Mycolicibacter terrae]SNV94700.1 Uncharacterised protein [Mycolicibacter terrae]